MATAHLAILLGPINWALCSASVKQSATGIDREGQSIKANHSADLRAALPAMSGRRHALIKWPHVRCDAWLGDVASGQATNTLRSVQVTQSVRQTETLFVVARTDINLEVK